MFVGVSLQAVTADAANGGWEYEPYRIRALLAIDLPGGLTQQLGQELPSYLQHRVEAALFPLWNFEIRLTAGAERTFLQDALAADYEAIPNLPPIAINSYCFL